MLPGDHRETVAWRRGQMVQGKNYGRFKLVCKMKWNVVCLLNRNQLESDESEIVTNVSSYVFNKTGRKPIILPVIMDIKRG